jgi:uncharacterized damage-inducible protein DinB
MATRYASRNEEERARLAALVKRITDEELSQPVGNAGWTVAGLLAHLAFWDRRALLLLRRWQEHGVGPSALDIDIVNDTARAFLVALPVRTAARMALEAADAIDGMIESLSAEILAEVENDGKTVRLDRAVHRQHHLGQIEETLLSR